MTPEQSVLHIARIVLETTAPLSIGSGARDGLVDTMLVVDANGLPAIPGSSLAGVLRHRYAEAESESEAAKLFGYTGEKGAGDVSRVGVSWGVIHDAKDSPVEGLGLPDELKKDSILGPLITNGPPIRDHVRISAHGVAANQGKFDRSYLPPGYRFSCELTFWIKADDPDAGRYWQLLLKLFAGADFRLGGATRRGFGSLKVVRACGKQFDMTKDLDAWCALSRDIGDTTNLDRYEIAPEARQALRNATVILEPVDFWRFGQGDAPINAAGKAPDQVPLSGRYVEWNSGTGNLSDRQVIVPASGVKGALAHRVAYHYNRLSNRYADEHARDYDSSAENEAVRTLFGYAKAKEEDRDHEEGRSGCVIFDDLYLPAQRTLKMPHNSIDRFTGGTRDKVLFAEEVVYGGELRLGLTIDVARVNDGDGMIRRALAAALNDLTHERLSLGGGAAKGHGFFRGQIAWDDEGKWIGGMA